MFSYSKDSALKKKNTGLSILLPKVLTKTNFPFIIQNISHACYCRKQRKKYCSKRSNHFDEFICEIVSGTKAKNNFT